MPWLLFRAVAGSRRKLGQREPNNTEWQGMLAISYNKIGEILQARGDPTTPSLPSRPAARSWISSSRASPAIPPGSATGPSSQEKIGEVLQARGELQGALRRFPEESRDDGKTEPARS